MPPRPNILFFFPDQHRPDWLQCATPGLPLRTPHIDALAARGVRFRRALCSAPLCAPSRACVASGRSYDRCGVPGNEVNYPLDQPTYYQALREAGYHVAGVGKFDGSVRAGGRPGRTPARADPGEGRPVPTGLPQAVRRCIFNSLRSSRLTARRALWCARAARSDPSPVPPAGAAGIAATLPPESPP